MLNYETVLLIAVASYLVGYLCGRYVEWESNRNG